MAGTTETLARLFRDQTRVSSGSANSEQIAPIRAFLSYFVHSWVVDTADSDTVLSTPSGEDVGRRGCDSDSETELTGDVRSK